MAIYPGTLSRALKKLEERRAAARNAQSMRRAEVYASCPEIAEADARVRATAFEAVKCALTGDGGEGRLRELRRENLGLQSRRRELLAENAYPPGYLDVVPACALCEDTGYISGRMCRCLVDACEIEQKRELSRSLRLDAENFDTFCFEYYSEKVDSFYEMSPRENIMRVFDFCSEYARHFGEGSPSLLITGSPGTGKTFLCSCIAGKASERASVVYGSAVDVFSRLEEEKFGRAPEGAQEELRRYRMCDLLILDDLGSEMTTPVTTSSLYALLSRRLTEGKKTVVASALSVDELSRRYPPQVMSRLEGDFVTLPLFGGDIRLIRQ